MSNEEEKRCPLCAEEMDWTDQQFKPCKCGYQICVWCWHHIIDMAEKEEIEGRCPACRIVYEKEKIVAMQADCERMAGKSSNRKTKPPKAKPKTNEVKRDLTNVRVIQRKMAYVIGLPLSLADEHLLQRKEYFGQYGKVTKISLSRTAGGTIQQFVNDTCSVYITFSKEEEALRCIQSVHGFVLEDRILRASFGTAKYCHAWLKNMPCNNSACLYLHTLGADEDSFGKDEVAAVHTRSRVQEIVGAGNTGIKRAGSVLPPPVDDLYHSTPSLPDRSTIGSPACDAIHGSIDTLSSRDRVTGVPHKMTTFVDVVGRPNSSGPDKNGMVPDDPGVSHLSSELSSVTIGRDIHPDEPYSGPPLFRVSSTNLTGNGLYRSISNEPLREDQLLYDSQGLNDSGAVGQRACSHPSNTAIMSEDSSGSALIRKTQSLNDFSVNANPVHNHEEAASLLTNCINAVLSDASHEMTFQNSAKSDRIYRGSNSFSNEEIVEHLRRIEGDNQINDDENSARNVVKNSSVSNFMSDFDSCDSLVIRNGLSELLDEPDIFPISSWNSSGSDQSGYSFVNQDVYASQLPGTVLPDFGDKRDQYLSNPPYPATRTQNFAPPGFNMPSRDPPPGFSSCERTGSLPRPSSGGRLVTSSLPTNMLQQSSKGFNASVDFNDPAILSCGKPTNEGKTPGFGMRHGSTPQMNMFEDDASLWILLQQQNSAYQDSKFSQVFGAPQVPVTQDPPPSYTPHTMSGLNGLSSTPGLLNQHQNYHPSSIPQQKYSNGHISSNGNGYLHGMEEFRHKGDAEVERNEMLGGLNNYFAGYGGAFSSSGDIYSRVFGL